MVLTAMPRDVRSRFVVVDGIRTHYLEAGDGFPVALLHSGEYGASAELSWEHNIGALAGHFRVVAPDWLGFGQAERFNLDAVEFLTRCLKDRDRASPRAGLPRTSTQDRSV